jgi:putative transposase
MRHDFLKTEIKRVFEEHKGRYGSPRIALQLYDEGIETNKRVVERLMRELNLCAVGYHRRKKCYGQNKPIEDVIKENSLNRAFDQDIIDAVRFTDITHVSYNDGRLYLSTYIDPSARIPRCFKVYSDMKKHIVIEPLGRYRGKLLDVVHSVPGSQYRSGAYRDLLESNGTTHSMSEPGTPVDNAVIVSFH